MRKKKLLIALVLLSGGCASAPGRYGGTELYKNFAEMSAANAEGGDYSREIRSRGSKIAVFAVHGGYIEPGTALVAKGIAGADYNLYVFGGLSPHDSRRLHITAAHFDDPMAVGLATAAVLGLSVHGWSGSGSMVCVGGLNRSAAEAVALKLKDAGFSVEAPCAPLPGVSPNNIVNRPAQGGVQLEITLPLLKRLEKSPEDLSKFTEAVRSAAGEYLLR